MSTNVWNLVELLLAVEGIFLFYNIGKIIFWLMVFLSLSILIRVISSVLASLHTRVDKDISLPEIWDGWQSDPQHRGNKLG